jgi:SAM-dependent methyltransferase
MEHMEHGDVDTAALLAEQLAYYRRRAAGYDAAYRHVDTPEIEAAYQQLERFVAALPAAGPVVELACGTGRWTPFLLGEGVERLFAVDAAAEMLDVHAHGVSDPRIERVCADVFAWRPPAPADLVFFGFWLSHVPLERLAEFWRAVAAMLAPGGCAAFVDSGPAEAAYERWADTRTDIPVALRTAGDGRCYRVVKVIRPAAELQPDLRARGWDAHVHEVGNFIAGHATPPLGVS